MSRRLLFGEVMAFVAMFVFVGLMLLGGADRRLVGIGAGGSIAFAVMVQVLWNARVRREARDAERNLHGPVYGIGTAPHPGRSQVCSVFECEHSDEYYDDCRTHGCNACGRPLSEHVT